MNRQLIIHRLLEEEYARCSELYNGLADAFSDLPKGSLTNRDQQLCRFVRENGKQFLVPILNDDKLINELRLRRTIKESLPDLKCRINACEAFLKKEKIYDPISISKSLPQHYQGIKELNVFLDGDVDTEKWRKLSYPTNPAPFKRKHYTSAGIQCRSKSEALIGTRLEERGIPYRYETRLVLPWRTVYADFQILLERVRRVSYLEHFGNLDDLEYTQDSMDKIAAYEAGGFLLGYNFFFTSETEKNPLNMKTIDKKLDEIMKWDRI